MSEQPTESDARQARIDAMIDEFRAAQRRR